MWGNIIEKRLKSFAFEKSPCISLSCKLVTVQYREFENSLFAGTPHLLSGETLRSAKRVKYLTKGQAQEPSKACTQTSFSQRIHVH